VWDILYSSEYVPYSGIQISISGIPGPYFKRSIQIYEIGKSLSLTVLEHARSLLVYFGNFWGWQKTEQYVQAELMKEYTMKLHHNKVPDKGQLAQAAKEELKRMEAEKQHEQSEATLENNEVVDAKIYIRINFLGKCNYPSQIGVP
jgi:hypothetical protein